MCGMAGLCVSHRMTQAEGRLTRSILKELRGRGGWWVKIHGHAYQEPGIPDIIGCYRGVFIGFEVKVPGKAHTLTQRQGLTLQRIREAQGFSALIESKRGASELLDELDSALNSQGCRELPQ